jgi:hypothetical protein
METLILMQSVLQLSLASNGPCLLPQDRHALHHYMGKRETIPSLFRGQ